MSGGFKMGIEHVIFGLGLLMMVLATVLYLQRENTDSKQLLGVVSEFKQEVVVLKKMITDLDTNQRNECSSLWGTVNKINERTNELANRRYSATFSISKPVPVAIQGMVPIEVIKKTINSVSGEATPLLKRAGIEKNSIKVKPKSSH